MTTTKALSVLMQACSRTGLDSSDAVPLHKHAAMFYLFETQFSEAFDFIKSTVRLVWQSQRKVNVNPCIRVSKAYHTLWCS